MNVRAWLMGALLMACGPIDGSTPDGAVPDAGAPSAASDADAEDALPGDAVPDATADAETADATADDADGVDAEDFEAGSPDAEPVDSGPADVGPADSGAYCGNGAIDPGEECDDGNTAAGDGCASLCERELRVVSLGATCSLVLDHTPSSGSHNGTALGANHIFAANGIRDIRTFELPLLTNPQVIPEEIEEIFSDLRTSTVYTLTEGGFSITGYQAIADGVRVVTAAGTGALIPLSSPILLRSKSSRFSGRGFVIVLDRDILTQRAIAAAYRIDLPSGAVTDLGPMPAFGTETTCPGVVGIAESFGGSTYLIAPDVSLSRMSVIKRHRVPDGLTSIVAEVGDLGYVCTLTASEPLGRWFFEWNGPSQFGGTGRSIASCDAAFGPGSDGIVPFPGVRKDLMRGDTASNLTVGAMPGTVANRFIAPAGNTQPVALGAWLTDEGLPGRPNVRFEVWGSTPAGEPDINQIIATTGVVSPSAAPVTTYFEFPVAPGGPALTAGATYWMILTSLAIAQPPNAGRYRVGRHAQNTDGLVDNGISKFSWDPIGIFFEANPAGSWVEMAFTVELGP
jgi:cysteine-rich repeat protein